MRKADKEKKLTVLGKETVFGGFLKFTEEQFRLLNELSQGNLRMLNKLMFNIFELYEYFDANQPTIIGGDKMVTKILEMAAIKSELIDA